MRAGEQRCLERRCRRARRAVAYTLTHTRAAPAPLAVRSRPAGRLGVGGRALARRGVARGGGVAVAPEQPAAREARVDLRARLRAARGQRCAACPISTG